jgi:SAM-dependent methyltransferase
MGAAHPSDRQLVATWADGIEGAVLDAGCGPGHWTNFLHEAGMPALGVDLVPEFIEHARAAYPGIPFRTGSLDALDVRTGTIGGVLAWYSLIHHVPDTIRTPLLEFRRVLSPGGALLVGFFEGTVVENVYQRLVGRVPQRHGTTVTATRGSWCSMAHDARTCGAGTFRGSLPWLFLSPIRPFWFLMMCSTLSRAATSRPSATASSLVA